VKGGLLDIQDELAKINLQLVELKNEEREKINATTIDGSSLSQKADSSPGIQSSTSNSTSSKST
jgi:hypothetical protein